MTKSDARTTLVRTALATMPNVTVILSADVANASQGPGGGMGTASPLTQLVMAVIVYGAAGAVVVAGLIGAACRR